MSKLATYITFILLFSVTSSWGMDIDQLRERKLNVKLVYTQTGNVFLSKVHTFIKARKLSTGCVSDDTQVRKAFSGIYKSSDVVFDHTSFKKDIEIRRYLKRNRKAVLNRKTCVPEPDILKSRTPHLVFPTAITDLIKTIRLEHSTLLCTGKSLLVFLSSFRN